MFHIFTTREVSMALWTFVFFIIIFMSKKVRKSAIGVIKAAKKLVITFIPMLVYSILLTYLFSLTSIWKYDYIKDITLWLLFVGIPLYYGAIQKMNWMIILKIYFYLI